MPDIDTIVLGLKLSATATAAIWYYVTRRHRVVDAVLGDFAIITGLALVWCHPGVP
jgi:hypothetical protein